MGKGSTSTSTVQVPASVLARYNSVNASAQTAAATPFQDYSGEFVAPVNSEENSGIAGATTAANEAQPYYGEAQTQLNAAQAATQPYYSTATSDTATGVASAQPYQTGATQAALAGAQAVDPTTLTGADINQYMSPYLNDVLGSESAVLNQNNQQQQAGQLGDAITSGAFGGDRTGIAAANLEQQQNLANSSIYSNILNTGYNTALATAQQQQGVDLSAAQANRTAVQGLAPELQSIGQQGYAQDLGAGAQEAALGQDVYNTGAATSAATAALGTGAQTAAEQGASGELAAGELQQQTAQAQDTAEYNQFLQQQSYPFQVDQFLANIAEGTGALSGSTTSTTQPLFSDERLKEDIEPVGKTFDGQNIYKFRYKGSNAPQLGLLAQEVEKKHPEAVGLASGYKTVNYDKAINDNHGLASGERKHYAAGGYPMALPGESPNDMSSILQAQASMYAPFSGSGLYGSTSGASGLPRGGTSYVPNSTTPVAHLAVAQPPRPVSAMSEVNDMITLGKDVNSGVNWGEKTFGQPSSAATPSAGASDPDIGSGNLFGSDASDVSMRRGGLASGRRGYDIGGAPDDADGPQLNIPNDNPQAKLATATPPAQGNGLGQALQTAAQIGMMFASRGGLASGRRGYDIGGAPDDDSTDDVPGPTPFGPQLNIPNDNPQAKLAVAQPPSGGSGLGSLVSGIGTAVSTGLSLFGLASGGRAADRRGYDDGGSPSDDGDDFANTPLGRALSGIGNAAATGAGDMAAGLGKGLAGIGSAASGLATGTTIGSLLGKVLTPDTDTAAAAPAPAATPAPATPRPARHTGLASGTHTATPAAVPASAPSSAVDLGTDIGSGDILNATSEPPAAAATSASTPVALPPQPPVNPGDASFADSVQGNALASPSLTPAASAPNGLASGLPTDRNGAPTDSGGPLDTIKSALGSIGSKIAPQGGYISRLTHGDPNTLIPFLTGLAAMETAPTHNPLIAASMGLGAGAQAYYPTQEKQAQVAQTQAQTHQIGATASEQNLAISKNLQISAAMGRLRADPQGPIVDPATGMRYSNTQSTPEAGATPAAAASSYKYLGPNLTAAVEPAAKAYFMDAPVGAGANPARVANSEAMANDIYNSASAAKTSLLNLNEQAGAIFSPARQGPLEQGALAPIFAPWVANWNAAMAAAGNPDAQLSGLGDVQIAHKLQIGQAAAQASESGQNSLQALQGFEASSAGPGLDPKAAATLLAQQAVLATKASDKRDVLDEARSNSPYGNIETPALSEAFDKDYSPQMYDNMRDTLASLYQSPLYQTLQTGLSAPPNSAQYQTTVKTLDAFGQQKGIPRFSRVFTGG